MYLNFNNINKLILYFETGKIQSGLLEAFQVNNSSLLPIFFSVTNSNLQAFAICTLTIKEFTHTQVIRF